MFSNHPSTRHDFAPTSAVPPPPAPQGISYSLAAESTLTALPRQPARRLLSGVLLLIAVMVTAQFTVAATRPTVIQQTAAGQTGADKLSRAAGALHVLVAAALVVLARRREPFRPRLKLWVGCWSLLVVLGVLPIAFQQYIYPMWALGDFAIMALPVLYMLLSNRLPQLFHDPRTLQLLALGLVAAAIAQLFFERASGRFEPPHHLVFVLLAFWILRSRSWSQQLVLLLVYGGMYLLALTSMQRATAMAAPATFVLAAWLEKVRWRPMIELGLLSSVPLFIVILLAAPNNPLVAQVESLADGTRFMSLLKGEDASLDGRLLEARDVIQARLDQRNPLVWLIGAGHGGTYWHYADRVRRNMSSNMRLHHIHIGPLALWYRHGLIGVACYVAFLAAAGRYLLHSRRAPRLQIPHPSANVFFVAVAVGLVHFMFGFVLQHAVFAFAVAGAVVHFAELPKRRQWA